MMTSRLAPLVLLLAAGLAGCASTPGAGEPSDFEQARSAYLAEDYQRALPLMQREAELGNPHAQYTLGYMYYYGRGVQQNLDLALKWIRQAAAQGDARALEALSSLAAANMQPATNTPPSE